VDDEVKLILRRADELRAIRQNFDWHWQEVADYILPSREFTRTTSPGQKRLTRIFNTLPVLACEQLAGGLHGMLTSPALRWFQLQVRSRDLRQDDDAQRWFADTTDRLYDHFNSQEAGFATAAHEFYLDIAAFGTAVMYVPDLGDAGAGFRPTPLAECYVSENAAGRIDTLFRCFKQTRRQVLEQWPDLSHAEFRKAASQRPDEHVDIIHAVQPETQRRRMPFRSVYVVRSPEIVLERGGYRSFPYVVARWSKRSGEIYGNSAGMNALPDVKLLNKIEEVTLRAGQKAVDPPLMVPDDGFLNPLDTRPGGVNVFRSGMVGDADRIAPLNTGSRPDLGEMMAERAEARVKSTFYSDWMNLPRQPNMTATEVIQRRDEMLRLLGPMVSRLTAEMLGPIIERTFRIHLENGLLAPLPPQLAGADWRIEYLSPLAISQKSSDADAVLRWFTVASQMAAVDPSVLDTMDMGEAARFLADRYNAPPTLMRTREEAAARAAERQQAEQMAQGVQMADTAARAFKTGAQGVGELAAAQGAA
jgi:hypothetical protein